MIKPPPRCAPSLAAKEKRRPCDEPVIRGMPATILVLTLGQPPTENCGITHKARQIDQLGNQASHSELTVLTPNSTQVH